MTTKQLLFVSVFLLSAFFTQAQTYISSPYSRYGLGDLFTHSVGQSQAMGGTFMGLRDPNHLNFNNPASYTSLDSLSFLFEMGGLGRASMGRSGELENQSATFNFNYLAAGFRIKKGWAASFGLLPYSSVGYELQTSGELALDGDDVQRYITSYAGLGGLSQVFIGQAIDLGKYLSLGVNARYYFGSLDHVRVVSFVEEDGTSSQNYFNTRFSDRILVSDFSFDFGLQAKKEFSNNRQLTAGITYAYNDQLSGFANHFIEKANSAGLVDTIINIDSEKSSVSLPARLGLGLTFRTDQWTLSADYQQQDWTGASFINQQDSLANSNRFAFGAEFIPNSRNVISFWSRTRYRVGAFYHNTYWNINQNQVSDYGISFGLGLPVNRGKSTVNFNVILGQRGSLEQNLLQENYALFSINLSLHDIWFLKRKFD